MFEAPFGSFASPEFKTYANKLSSNSWHFLALYKSHQILAVDSANAGLQLGIEAVEKGVEMALDERCC